MSTAMMDTCGLKAGSYRALRRGAAFAILTAAMWGCETSMHAPATDSINDKAPAKIALDAVSPAQLLAVAPGDSSKFVLKRYSGNFPDPDQDVWFGAPGNYGFDAHLVVDMFDKSSQQIDYASARLDSGWALSSRSGYFPPVRTVRLTTGTGSTLVKEIARQLSRAPHSRAGTNGSASASATVGKAIVLIYITPGATTDAGKEYVFLHPDSEVKSVVYKYHVKMDDADVKTQEVQTGKYWVFDRSSGTWEGPYSFPKLDEVAPPLAHLLRQVSDATPYKFYAD